MVRWTRLALSRNREIRPTTLCDIWVRKYRFAALATDLELPFETRRNLCRGRAHVENRIKKLRETLNKSPKPL